MIMYQAHQLKSSLSCFHCMLKTLNSTFKLSLPRYCGVVKPGKENNQKPYLQAMNGLEKSKAVLLAGRDCLVRFSPVVSLRYMANSHGTDSTIAHKLARVARIHFSRQKLAASGPNLPSRQALFDRLLKSEAIKKAIEDEAQAKNISIEKASKEAQDIMDEIAANFSYSLIKRGEKISWLVVE